MDLDQHLPDILAGDADAFARWVAGAEPRVRASLRPLAAQVDCEAVVQEALLRVWQVAPRFVPDGRPNGLLRLAIRIAWNLARSELRRDRVTALDADALQRAAEADADVVSEPDPLLRRRIRACLDTLSAKPLAALTTRIEAFGGAQDLDLAEALGMTLNTFLQNVVRARKALARCLTRQGVALPGQEVP